MSTRVDATELRRDLYGILSQVTSTGELVEVVRHGKVLAVLSRVQPESTAMPPLDKRRLARICQRFHVSRLSVFGSARDNMLGPTSDIDLAFDAPPAKMCTLRELVELTEALTDLFGRPVDLYDRAFTPLGIDDVKVIYEA